MSKTAILFAILTISIPCAAGTITVNWDGTGDHTTIQAGINAAVSGVDTVEVAVGTYVENINFNGKNIILTSMYPSDPNTVRDTIIDGGGSGRVVTFSGTETSSCELTGFTITNGSASYGGGIDGGDFPNATHATISYCTITNNIVVYSGAGVEYFDGLITNSIISDNTSGGSGGGLAYCGGTMMNCTISGNTAIGGSGGGLFSCDGVITNCTFSNNNTGSDGGALSYFDGIITNSIISNNTADNRGGGLYKCDGSTTNCIIINNTANSSGGLHDSRGGGTRNCIVWDNFPDQIGNSAPPYYCCVQNWGSGGIGNITKDPLFIDPDNGNYHLDPGSHCIDAGTNTPPGGLPATDLDGNPRPMDGDNDGIAIADIGLYETYASVDPVIWLSKYEFDFSALEGGSDPDGQVLSIRNFGVEELNWQVVEDCDWLTVIPESGSSTGEPNDVTLSVDITSLPQGNYSCDLTISDPNAVNNPQTVSVDLDVIGPTIGLSQSSFTFTAVPGGSNPDDQILTITNTGGKTLNWQISYSNCDWLTVLPISGSSAGEGDAVTLSVDITGLTEPDYNCQLTISDPNAENSPQFVDVSLLLDCYVGMPDYAQWVAVGKPECWCYPTQCEGDVDGYTQGAVRGGGIYHVGSIDIGVLAGAWDVKEPPNGPGITSVVVGGIPGACADFNHGSQGTAHGGGPYRIGSIDIGILAGNWMVKEPPAGPGIAKTCQPGNRTPP